MLVDKNIFFYDGSCEFCTKLAHRLEKYSLNDSLKFTSFRDCTEEDLKSFHPSLTKDVCTGNIQYVLNGKRYPGFFAIRKLSHSLRIYRYFSFILYLPLVPILGILVMNGLKQVRQN